jgi:hypothetical protein
MILFLALRLHNKRPLRMERGSMSKDKKPLLSDEFIDELVKEINHLYGDTSEEQNNEESINESD